MLNLFNLTLNGSDISASCLLMKISDVIGYYLITIAAFAGFILNLANIKLLAHKSLKHRFYKYLMCKSILDATVCFLGMGYLNNQSIPTFTDNYWLLFYKLYIVKIPLRIEFMVLSLSEIYLTLNRICTFSKTKNRFSNISIKYYMLIIIGFPFSLSIIPYFSLSIRELNQTGVYYWSTTTFGFSKLFLFYSLLVLFFESVIPTILLIAFNLVVLFKYKSRLKFRISLNIQTIENIKKTDHRFTKMIIIVTGVYSVTHFFDMLSAIANRLVVYTEFQYSDQTYSIIFFFRAATYLLLYLQFVLNIFIYISIDPNMRKIFEKHLFHVNIN